MNYDDGLVRGITASSFDLLHAGHILMLREAKSVCDYLICALQTDPTIDRPEKNKPIQSYMERYIQLSAIKYVDEIIPYATEEECLALLNHLPVHIRNFYVQQLIDTKEEEKKQMDKATKKSSASRVWSDSRKII